MKGTDALREPFVPSNPRGTPSQDEIRSGLEVNWDAETQTVKGIEQIHPGFVKRDEIAWVGPHRHAPGGNQIYVASYLFRYAIDLPPGTREIVLPSDARVRILAVTAVNEPATLVPAAALYAPELPDPGAKSRTPAALKPATPTTGKRRQ